jgi:hypothetical protein
MEIGPHPDDEKNLGRIVGYLMAEFDGQRWMRDPMRAGPVFYLSTMGPHGRHFLGVTEDFLSLYRFKDVVAVVAGRGLVDRLHRAKGGMRVLVTESGLQEEPV